MTIEPLPNSNNAADTPQGAPFKVSELQLPEMHFAAGNQSFLRPFRHLS
jgi:hypothetical protein